MGHPYWFFEVKQSNIQNSIRGIFLTFADKILRYEDRFCFYASRQESPAVRQW